MTSLLAILAFFAFCGIYGLLGEPRARRRGVEPADERRLRAREQTSRDTPAAPRASLPRPRAPWRRGS